MSWLKLDDGFAQHEKIISLPRGDRWTWLEVLLYCAKQEKGRIPAAIREAVPKATPEFLERCADLELLDRNGSGGYYVHDWVIYNGKTVAAKVAAYLTKHPNATGNDVVKAVGGNRQAVLAEVERQRQGGS